MRRSTKATLDEGDARRRRRSTKATLDEAPVDAVV